MKLKKNRFPVLLLAMATTLVSCNIDDGNGGGPPPPIPILANVYAVSNTSNNVMVYDFTPNGIGSRFFLTSSEDNEGIYYDVQADELVINSRSQKSMNTYSNVENTANGEGLNFLLSSNTILQSPRDIAVSNGFYVVSDNADVDGNPSTDDGRLFIFTRDASGYTLRNTVTVEFALWGIEFIGNDLYTVVDKTSDVAVLSNFISTYTTDVTAAPDKQITIEGIERTHGIVEDGGTVILTDIGDATILNDGAIHAISDFVSKFNAVPDGDVLPIAGNQTRVSGNFTQLGNPVAVDYENISQTIFVAERANEGGKVLFFSEIGPGGNIQPSFSSPFPGISSLVFVDR